MPVLSDVAAIYRNAGFPNIAATHEERKLMIARELAIQEKLGYASDYEEGRLANEVADYHGRPQPGLFDEGALDRNMQQVVRNMGMAEANLFDVHIEMLQAEDQSIPLKGAGPSAAYFNRALEATKRDMNAIEQAMGPER